MGAPSSGHSLSARGSQPSPSRLRMARNSAGLSLRMSCPGSDSQTTRPSARAPLRRPTLFAASANPAPTQSA